MDSRVGGWYNADGLSLYHLGLSVGEMGWPKQFAVGPITPCTSYISLCIGGKEACESERGSWLCSPR